MVRETGDRNGAAQGPLPPCPCCSSPVTEIFYSLASIPVHSCILVESRGESLEHPRRRMDLGFCDACGFIFNTAFDPNVHEYSQDYEDTQAFSPTFSSFARVVFLFSEIYRSIKEGTLGRILVFLW